MGQGICWGRWQPDPRTLQPGRAGWSTAVSPVGPGGAQQNVALVLREAHAHEAYYQPRKRRLGGGELRRAMCQQGGGLRGSGSDGLGAGAAAAARPGPGGPSSLVMSETGFARAKRLQANVGRILKKGTRRKRHNLCFEHILGRKVVQWRRSTSGTLPYPISGFYPISGHPLTQYRVMSGHVTCDPISGT